MPRTKVAFGAFIDTFVVTEMGGLDVDAEVVTTRVPSAARVAAETLGALVNGHVRSEIEDGVRLVVAARTLETFRVLRGDAILDDFAGRGLRIRVAVLRVTAFSTFGMPLFVFDFG